MADVFVGRRSELRRLAPLARSAGLVTLVGPPGVGKTRLAKEVVASLRGASWFADLHAARTATEVAAAVARALGVVLAGREDGLVAEVGAALAARPGLVVLDNCEQAADAVRTCVEAWKGPRTTFVATSRVPLAAAGERRFAVDPLPDAAAVALFVARSGCDADADVGRLVQALDRLPLAIEMAAARRRVLSPADLLDRLSRGDWEALAGSAVWPSLAAAIATSWELLSERGRRVLAETTVFRTPFSAADVEALLGAPALDELDELVLASLLVVRPGTPVRFTLLESVRDFASGTRAPEVEDRHAAWALRRFAEVEGAAAFADGRPDQLDDLCAAHAHLLDRSPADALALAYAATRVVHARGPLALARSLLASALTRTGPAGRDAMRATRTLAVIEDEMGERLAATRRLEDLVARARQAGDDWNLAAALFSLGRIRVDEGSLDAGVGLLDEAQRIAVANRDASVACWALTSIGDAGLEERRVAEAERAYDAARRIAEEASRPADQAIAWRGLAQVALVQDELALAEARLDRALASLGSADANLFWRAGALETRGYVRCQLGRHDEAAADLAAASALYEAMGATVRARIRARTAVNELDRGNVDLARRLAKESLAAAGAADVVRSCIVVGLVAWAGGRPAEAADAWRSALARATGRERAEVAALLSLATAGPEASALVAGLDGVADEDGTLAVVRAVVAGRAGDAAAAALHLADAERRSERSAEVRALLAGVRRGVARPIRVLARWDTVHVLRDGQDPVVLGGMPARVLSELVALRVPAPWDVVAREVWRDEAPSAPLRRRWDSTLSRLRKQLGELGLRGLVHTDRHGNVELVPGDVVLVDET